MQLDVAPPVLTPANWNFDSVPDHQLIACCYWEYARESVFFREFKARCVHANRHRGTLAQTMERCGKDSRRILTIGPVAHSILLGFGFEPDHPGTASRGTNGSPILTPSTQPAITGNFPAPWQSLSLVERNYRAELAREPLVPALPPFRRADGADAVNALLFLTDSIFARIPPMPPEMYQRDLQDKIDLLNAWADPKPPLACEVAPSPATPNAPARNGTNGASSPAPETKPPLVAPRVLRLDHHGQFSDEIALMQIDWASATDDQLVRAFRAWLKANRPATLRSGFARGHKPRDWRANLTRLAVMRLLASFSALEIVDLTLNKFPALWKTRQFSGASWCDPIKWHDARREARALFHQLFPFLAPTEDPLSWPTPRHHRLAA